ncbi:hypothetical protein EYF80_032730 [Liparis tanakae]|uniref:Uncharacterized protein n=1 Tax=Liparis tanakae TaxID=230148 RepID=A0A4Z2GVE5_9TELE|nr:hypothetical protein EYF80_032730 [Liparis tanakae]
MRYESGMDIRRPAVIAPQKIVARKPAVLCGNDIGARLGEERIGNQWAHQGSEPNEEMKSLWNLNHPPTLPDILYVQGDIVWGEELCINPE